MTALLICDASAVVALLVDGGQDGRWVTDAVAEATLAAPDVVFFESANVFRRLELAGRISPDTAAQAHADLLDLPLEAWPYQVLAGRVWDLRHNVSSYDASYVALAELTGAALVTLDRRIARAAEVRAEVLTP